MSNKLEIVKNEETERIINPGFLIIMFVVTFIILNISFNNYQRTSPNNTGFSAQIEKFYSEHVAIF